jgi:hypothetical protein
MVHWRQATVTVCEPGLSASRAVNGVHACNGACLDAAIARRRTGAPVGWCPVVLCGQAEAAGAVHAGRLAGGIVL